MDIFEKKTLRQLEGVERWRQAKGRGTLWYETGVGKTYTACLLLQKYLPANAGYAINIVVPNDTLLKQWKEHIMEMIEYRYHADIHLYTIGRLLERDAVLGGALLILDEIHEYYSPAAFSLISRFRHTHILGLTATFKDKEGREIQFSSLCPVVDYIGEEEALREGYISNFIEYNLAVQLTLPEQAAYFQLGEEIAQYQSKFGRNAIDKAAKILQGGFDDDHVWHKGYEYACIWASVQGWYKGCDPAIDDIWNPGKVIHYAKEFMECIRARKELLYTSNTKVEIGVQLIKKFKGLKTICFSQSTVFATKFAHAVNEELGREPKYCELYHSQMQTQLLPMGKNGRLIKVGKDRLKKIALAKLENGECTALSTSSALDKGLDIVDLQMAIITSGTSNSNQAKQRKGRVKRIDLFNPNFTVLIVNLYVKGSQDEKWLRSSQTRTTNRRYWVDSINEINYIPQINTQIKMN